MDKIVYYITGPVKHDQTTYWNELIGWVTIKGAATQYDEDILVSPLPTGASAVISETTQGEAVEFYAPPLISPFDLFI